MFTVECPTGLSFQAHAWNLGHITQLISIFDEGADYQARMLALVAGPVVNPGPYELVKGQPISSEAWNKISVADITWGNIAVRRQTKSKLELDISCSQPKCQKINEIALDINDPDYDMVTASEEGIQHIRTGIPIIREVNGVKAEIRLQRGSDFGDIARWQKEEPKAFLEIQQCMQIESIMAPGLDQPIKGMLQIREFWKHQSWDVAETIENAIDDCSGGVNLEFSFICQHCGKEQFSYLPLGPEFYGLDTRRLQRRRRRKSS